MRHNRAGPGAATAPRVVQPYRAVRCSPGVAQDSNPALPLQPMGCSFRNQESLGRYTPQDRSLHRFRQHRDRRQSFPQHSIRHWPRARGAPRAGGRRLQNRLRRLDPRRRLQPLDAARHQARAAQPDTRRRQERRRHQPRLDALEMAFTIPTSTPTSSSAATATSSASSRSSSNTTSRFLSCRRAQFHQRRDAAQLPRVRGLREPARLAARIVDRGWSRPCRAGVDRAGRAARATRAEGAQRSRGVTATRPAQEHAAPARLHLLGADLRAGSFRDFAQKLAAADTSRKSRAERPSRTRRGASFTGDEAARAPSAR